MLWFSSCQLQRSKELLNVYITFELYIMAFLLSFGLFDYKYVLKRGYPKGLRLVKLQYFGTWLKMKASLNLNIIFLYLPSNYIFPISQGHFHYWKVPFFHCHIYFWFYFYFFLQKISHAKIHANSAPNKIATLGLYFICQPSSKWFSHFSFYIFHVSKTILNKNAIGILKDYFWYAQYLQHQEKKHSRRMWA